MPKHKEMKCRRMGARVYACIHLHVCVCVSVLDNYCLSLSSIGSSSTYTKIKEERESERRFINSYAYVLLVAFALPNDSLCVEIEFCRLVKLFK